MTDRPPIDTLHPHDRITIFSRSTDHEDPLRILAQQVRGPIPVGEILDGTIPAGKEAWFFVLPLDPFWIWCLLETF
jgi:hypothetical protein